MNTPLAALAEHSPYDDPQPGLPPAEFLAAIWEDRRRFVRAGRIKQPHPWQVALGTGQLTRAAVAEYVKNRYYFLVNINRKDAQIIANCPFSDARRTLMRKYIDEEGQDLAGGPLGPHYEMWLRVAEALGIPWQRLLETEIQAERELRKTLGDLPEDAPLWRVFAALPMSLLDSWRVRERIRRLSWEARAASSRTAARDLRALSDHLAGKRAANEEGDPLLRHLEFAYGRVQELEHAARSAEKARGDFAARLRTVLKKTGCLEADARWAVGRALAPRQRTVIEDAMGRARSEGFEIPRASTEFQAWVRLRRFVRSGTFDKARRSRAAHGRAAWDPPAPARLPLVLLSTSPR